MDLGYVCSGVGNLAGSMFVFSMKSDLYLVGYCVSPLSSSTFIHLDGVILRMTKMADIFKELHYAVLLQLREANRKQWWFRSWIGKVKLHNSHLVVLFNFPITASIKLNHGAVCKVTGHWSSSPLQLKCCRSLIYTIQMLSCQWNLPMGRQLVNFEGIREVET